jgi:hypothetical protein
MTHTPGPWVKGGDNPILYPGYCLVFPKGGTMPIALVSSTKSLLDGPGMSDGRNADLIATAPDLLEKVREISKMAHGYEMHADCKPSLFELAEIATSCDVLIAQAEGRSK